MILDNIKSIEQYPEGICPFRIGKDHEMEKLVLIKPMKVSHGGDSFHLQSIVSHCARCDSCFT